MKLHRAVNSGVSNQDSSILPGKKLRKVMISEEKISLERLGNRVMTMSAELRDMQLRFSAMESRFSGVEIRIGALERTITAQLDAIASRFDGMERRQVAHEERMSRIPALLVRIAERLDGEGAPR